MMSDSRSKHSRDASSFVRQFIQIFFFCFVLLNFVKSSGTLIYFYLNISAIFIATFIFFPPNKIL